MSKINSRNYQLGLAFNDEDLRKPKHDQIMHWLTEWVKSESNIRSLVSQKYKHRQKVIKNILDINSNQQLSTLNINERDRIEQYLKNYLKDTYEDVSEIWEDEPQRSLIFKTLQWELPLKSERGPPLGFCDLYCQYEIGTTLCRVTTRTHRLEDTQPVEERFSRSWKFTRVEEHGSWEQHSTTLRLFFEVKTEIPSVGELMRQLQLYRTSETLRSYEDITGLIVVAPSNNEAASVCRSHGIEFVEYKPD